MKIAVIGGGVAGCGTALELAKAGHEVILLEGRSELLAGTSDDTPCRLGLGLHYPDIETGKKCLKATIEFLKQYPGFVVAQQEGPEHPYKRWRYFVVEGSQFSLDYIEKLYDGLKAEYSRLIEEDPSNKVLGEPEKFCCKLAENEYEGYVNLNRVLAGFETAEQVLNWPEFKQHLIKEIESHPEITICTNIWVQGIEHSDMDLGTGFVIRTKESGSMEDNFSEVKADMVINCAWENIGLINKSAGFLPDEVRTFRMKVIVEIKLPEDFEKNGQVNSMFFCFGPHCSFTNLGNGKGYISYEPVTNIAQQLLTIKDLKLKGICEELLYTKPSNETILEYGENILEGAIEYIPNLRGAEIVGAKFGGVVTIGTVNIHSDGSDHHKRHYSGVKRRQVGLVDNESMKLLFFLGNAREVSQLVKEDVQVIEAIKQIVEIAATGNESSENALSEGDKDRIKRALSKDLQRYMFFNDIKKQAATADAETIDVEKQAAIAETIKQALIAKQQVMRQIHNRFSA